MMDLAKTLTLGAQLQAYLGMPTAPLSELTNALQNLLDSWNGKARVTGRLRLDLHAADGTLLDSRDFPNLVVNVGLAYIADQLSDQGEVAMSHMAVGSGAVAVDPANTALGSELGRVALTSTTQSTNSVVYLATFGAGTGTGAITEAGIFNDVTAGTMLCRSVFAVINKAASDSLTVTWTLTITAV